MDTLEAMYFMDPSLPPLSQTTTGGVPSPQVPQPVRGTRRISTMPSKTFKIHTSVLFDPKHKHFFNDESIEVDRETGSIVDVVRRDDDVDPLVLADGDIDLRGKVVMPGFVDSHTHLFIHAYDERDGTEQMRDESAVERTVRATNHARAALLAGYTTLRDLGTEALGNADANLRDCINRGITPGPRLFVATDALASSGSYELRIENRLGHALVVPPAADVADGVAGVRAAVRRRVGDGADVIKFYADYRRKTMRFPKDVGRSKIKFLPAQRNPAVPNYSQEEMDTIVQEGKLADLPVAAHCGETKTAVMAARAGVTTVEHIFEDTHEALDELLEVMRKNKTIWVPTLATAPAEFLPWCQAAVKRAHDKGVRVAAGGDTGTFKHGLNVRELELMIQAGIPVEDVLEACTVGGWEACGQDQCGFRFGWFEKGNRADIIALDADPRTDKKALRKVSFVMKDGVVWKRNGVAEGMVPSSQWPSDGESSSDEWTDLSAAHPQTSMSVPPPMYGGTGLPS